MNTSSAQRLVATNTKVYMFSILRTLIMMGKGHCFKRWIPLSSATFRVDNRTWMSLVVCKNFNAHTHVCERRK
jgi:hypothetical protein